MTEVFTSGVIEALIFIFNFLFAYLLFRRRGRGTKLSTYLLASLIPIIFFVGYYWYYSELQAMVAAGVPEVVFEGDPFEKAYDAAAIDSFLLFVMILVSVVALRHRIYVPKQAVASNQDEQNQAQQNEGKLNEAQQAEQKTNSKDENK